MVVLKFFNLPSSPPHTRKERLFASGESRPVETLFFGAYHICIVRKSAVEFTGFNSGISIHLQILHEYTSSPVHSSRDSKHESALASITDFLKIPCSNFSLEGEICMCVCVHLYVSMCACACVCISACACMYFCVCMLVCVDHHIRKITMRGKRPSGWVMGEIREDNRIHAT